MTFPLASIAIAFVIVLLTKAPVARAMKELGKYDSAEPRKQQAQLTGWGGRALAAHMNSIEAFPPFAAAVLVGHVTLTSASRPDSAPPSCWLAWPIRSSTSRAQARYARSSGAWAGPRRWRSSCCRC